MKDCVSLPEGYSLEQAVLNAGGVIRRAPEGHTAFKWDGRPEAFVLLASGRLTVHFRTNRQQIPWAECRASDGQDCMPVTAAILSDREISVRAICMSPCTWIELSPTSLVLLVHGQRDFCRALFSTHAKRLPTFFARLSSRNVISLERRVAAWLLSHASRGTVAATHGEIAADLLTAREVVSRKLQEFATKGWIEQGRGRIQLGAPAALSRLAKGTFAVCERRAGSSEQGTD